MGLCFFLCLSLVLWTESSCGMSVMHSDISKHDRTLIHLSHEISCLIWWSVDINLLSFCQMIDTYEIDHSTAA